MVTKVNKNEQDLGETGFRTGMHRYIHIAFLTPRPSGVTSRIPPPPFTEKSIQVSKRS